MLFRIFCNQPKDELFLTEDNYNYLVRTLRLHQDDLFEVVNGTTEIHVFKITEITKKHLQAKLSEKYFENNDPAIKLTLIQPLLKNEKLEYVLQKCTEIGVCKFLLYHADRSPVKIGEEEKKILRWQKIIEAAVCQSRRSSLPAIEIYNSLAELLPQVKTPLYFANVDAEEKFKVQEADLVVVIGPEAGFSEQEEALLKNAGQPLSLGKTTLRTETASVALSAKVLI